MEPVSPDSQLVAQSEGQGVGVGLGGERGVEGSVEHGHLRAGEKLLGNFYALMQKGGDRGDRGERGDEADE